MSKFNWGRSSLERQKLASDNTRRVQDRALSSGIMDMSLICTHRNEADQTEAYDNGYSKVQWPNGKHNTLPAQAFDMYPYHPRFKLLTGSDEQVRHIAHKMEWSYEKTSGFITAEFHRMAGVILNAANVEGVRLRWGGDWDSDGDTTDQRFNDLGHFEEI